MERADPPATIKRDKAYYRAKLEEIERQIRDGELVLVEELLEHHEKRRNL